MEMMDAAAHGTLKALYIMGENPMVSDPDVGHVKKALEKLDLLIVQDIFPTETTALAHVVLPGGHLRREGRDLRFDGSADPAGPEGDRAPR